MRKNNRLLAFCLVAIASVSEAAPIQSNILRFNDVINAYYCKAIADQLDPNDTAPTDPQSKLVEDQCTKYIADNPEIQRMTLVEISEALAALIQTESVAKINFTLRGIQDDFLAAEGAYPRNPEALWMASGNLLKDLSASLGIYLQEQQQRLANGKTDPLLQALHGAFIVMSITKGGEISFKTARSGYFGWRALGNDFGTRSVNAMNLAIRNFANNLRPTRLAKNLWIGTKAAGRGVKFVTLKALSTVRNPGAGLTAAKNLSYAYTVSSIKQNKYHLLIGAAGGISYAAYKMHAEKIMDPMDFFDKAIIAGFDQLQNEWEMMYALSMAKDADAVGKISKDVGIEKEDLSELWKQVNGKLATLQKLSKGRNLDLPFDLMRNTMQGALLQIKELAPPKKKAEPAGTTAKPDVKATAAEIEDSSGAKTAPSTNNAKMDVGTNFATAVKLPAIPAPSAAASTNGPATQKK